MSAVDYLADFSTTDDALVLASVSSKAEFALLNDWLRAQRKANPDTRVDVVKLPHTDPSSQVVDEVAEKLNAGNDRTVVPVRVFWVPGGLPTRVKLAGLISGRDHYRPPEILQRAILKKDPSRARIVAGEPATVSELRKQWQENTVGNSPRDFAKFVLRRANLAIERIELRLLGPEYKSPRLVTDEIMTSSRFVDGLEAIPGATPEKAEAMLNELATGWSRFSVDLIPNLGRAIFSRGFDPRI
ncbi:MAG: glycerol-3-phosphate 1-O-acyltransferase, partial [Mycobacterium sp.]